VPLKATESYTKPYPSYFDYMKPLIIFWLYESSLCHSGAAHAWPNHCRCAMLLTCGSTGSDGADQPLGLWDPTVDPPSPLLAVIVVDGIPPPNPHASPPWHPLHVQI
jgi:hypothetical protein